MVGRCGRGGRRRFEGPEGGFGDEVGGVVGEDVVDCWVVVLRGVDVFDEGEDGGDLWS